MECSLKRVALKCHGCGQMLGYMTVPVMDNANNDLTSTTVFGKFSPICCPVCEVKRLQGGAE